MQIGSFQQGCGAARVNGKGCLPYSSHLLLGNGEIISKNGLFGKDRTRLGIAAGCCSLHTAGHWSGCRQSTISTIDVGELKTFSCAGALAGVILYTEP